MGLLNHPKVSGSSGHIVSGAQVDSPAGTVPSGAELDLAVMDVLLSVGHMQCQVEVGGQRSELTSLSHSVGSLLCLRLAIWSLAGGEGQQRWEA